MKNVDADSCNTERNRLINEYFFEQGYSSLSLEEMPPEIIEAAHRHADKILGEGNDN